MADHDPQPPAARSSGSAGKLNALLAYERIRNLIIEGDYLPGQRLIETRIALELGLSRTPVREALRRLEAEGLVRTEPNRGAIVRTVDVEEIHDIYGLRAQLEAYGAALAAERATEDDMAHIDGGIAALRQAITHSGPDDIEGLRAIHEANERTHAAIVSAAHHHRLRHLLVRTVDVPLVFQSFRQFDADRLQQSHLFHQLIRDAIAAREPERAANLMTEHILQGRDVLLDELDPDSTSAGRLFDS